MTDNKQTKFTSSNISTLLVQLLAVAYQPVGITVLVRIVRQLGIKNADGKEYNIQTLKPFLHELVKNKIINKKDSSFCCPSLTVETQTRQVVNEGTFSQIAEVIQDIIPLQNNWNSAKELRCQQAIREIRIALYSGQETQTLVALNEYETYFREYDNPHPLIAICFNPFDLEWFIRLPSEISAAAISAAVHSLTLVMENIDELLDWLINAQNNQTYQLTPELIYKVSKFLLLRGDLKRTKILLCHADDYHKSVLQGAVFFLEGSNDKAIEKFEQAFIVLKKITKKRKVCFENLCSVFFLLALFRRGTSSDLLKINEYQKITLTSNELAPNFPIYRLFALLFKFISGRDSQLHMLNTDNQWPNSNSALEYYIQVLVLFWTDKENAKTHSESLKKCITELKKSGYLWLLAECYELLSRLDTKYSKKNAQQAAQLRQSCGFETTVDIIKTKEPWERALDAISNLSLDKKKVSHKKKSRLIWILSLQNSYLSGVTIKEQKQNAKGGWSAGRKVAFKRLTEDKHSFDCLTEQDIQASKSIVASRDYWGVSYQIDGEILLPSLIGHPLLFSADKNETHMELIKGSPEIKITKKGDHLTITMTPQFNEHTDISVIEHTATQWKVIQSTAEQRDLASLIGDSLKIPVEAKEKVLSSMSAIAPFVDIHSDIGGGASAAESVDADDTLHMLLSPLDEGLKIEARTQIFGEKGPYYHPGAGGKTIIAEVDGKRLQTTRDLKLEQKNIHALIDQCPELNNIEMIHDAWTIMDPETCLEIILELKEQQGAIVSWPEGEKLKIHQTVGLSDFKMVIKKENNWFSADGEIKLDDGQVLNMQRLMNLTRSAKGRFISLADGQFIALTDTFKSRISELHAFGEEQDDKIMLHPLAALALDDMANEVGKLKSDKAWKSYISRFHEAMKLDPKVPSTLQAELRDYQKEGFQWLVRLAHWGVGACLADDMGLGKTVQAIALLLHRAADGPALVVAPTSVAMNWMDEIQRFSPTLNIIDYRESKRDEVLTNLDAFDIVICSYGLIQNNIQQLENVEWSTIILDEAQAIKNATTKRSQAIMRLKAEVKIVMTGTPIENHLGELWNLFRFINPGLLGSMENFNARYANPIVRDESIDTRQKLKKLIRPYILRRTKTQVLKELPPRTEIALQVEMSKDEAALYEALRREAVDKFTDSDLPQGHRQLQILAEITRLRRMCCNPALVLKVGAPASSKLSLFVNVVEELLDNNHKALVFSQFVDHLTILREKLDSMGVKYQYLDGSTPAKERRKRVTAFQSGEGDIFLISLKAGGVGLNLTAADYVIHMDPWWNPAVEDQASDRAHRIGQKRPVTVYRMITKNTIEEKIVALHQGKRALADNLLSGAEVAGKVKIEELLSLLQED
ncbi:DNA/RNA helicases, SNF2 family [hydrothermal vent metagenome]|uniref:DNA/RNA helicases, SNF2 family n=1 Tax=hydrothermal vent metagenome TaxID=652676 RepID=A0A3B0ZC69_9ZZZZ